MASKPAIQAITVAARVGLPAAGKVDRWRVAMRWCDLLFLHWPVSSEALRPLIPAGLEVELFDGAAWLGIVPFRMECVRWRWLPRLPGTHAFPELNVRTYVRCRGRPGVWFFSLDAASWLAVRVARIAYRLNYQHASVECAERDGWIGYRSRRVHRGAVPASLEVRYRPNGPADRAKPGSIEHWFSERYSLFVAMEADRIWRGDVEHEPWLLQEAAAEVIENTMADGLGLTLAGAPIAHFARRVEVRASGVRPLSGWPPP